MLLIFLPTSEASAAILTQRKRAVYFRNRCRQVSICLLFQKLDTCRYNNAFFLDEHAKKLMKLRLFLQLLSLSSQQSATQCQVCLVVKVLHISSSLKPLLPHFEAPTSSFRPFEVQFFVIWSEEDCQSSQISHMNSVLYRFDPAFPVLD